MEKQIIIEEYRDLGATVKYEVTEYFVNFWAKEHCSFNSDGSVDTFGSGVEDMTEDFDSAPRYLDGYVKWDNCCHYWFGEKDGYLHLCSGTKTFIELMGRTYAWCGELLGGFWE